MGALSRQVPSRQLDPSVVTVWRLTGAAAGAVVVLPVAALAAVTGWPWVWVAAVVIGAGAAVLAAWWPRVSYERFRWGVDDGVVRIHRGVLFRTEASVPASRIQHIDLTQGPVDRWLGLQKLLVHTAAPGADLGLPGLPAEEAPRVRAELLELARAAGTAGGATDAV